MIDSVEDTVLYDKRTYNTSPLFPDGKRYKRINVEGPANVLAGDDVASKATGRIRFTPGFK